MCPDILYLLLFLLFSVQSLENNGNKLGDVLKNHTKSVYNTSKNQNEEENLLKQETHKLLSECGVDTGSNYDNDDYDNRRGSKPRRDSGYGNFGDGNNNRRRNTDNRYNGNRNRGGNRNSDHSNENNNRYGNRGNRYNNENYSDEEDSNESNQGSNSRKYNRSMYSNNGYYYGNGYHNECNDRDNNRRPFGGNDGSDNRRPFGGNDGNYGYMRPGYMSLRAKRSNDDDSQCVSQCVFGYLEVLDDNRVPSETLVIKWLQEHLSNDMKRIRALREARRCFARLSTSDTEDGCEFSQSLSKCLNLELD